MKFSQLLTSYVMATGGALTTALGLNRLTKVMHVEFIQSVSIWYQRWFFVRGGFYRKWIHWLAGWCPWLLWQPRIASIFQWCEFSKSKNFYSKPEQKLSNSNFNWFDSFCHRELKNGISLVDDKYESLDVASKNAAYQGISAVIASRIAMAMPGMGTMIIINFISYYYIFIS